MKKKPINLDDYPEHAVWDPDNPPLTDEQLRRMRPLREHPELLTGLLEASAKLRAQKAARGRPPLEHPKIQVTLRLDEEIVKAFREDGPGWQSRINEELKKTVNEHRAHDMSYIGLDGFSRGWVAVQIGSHGRSIDFFENIERLTSVRFQRAAIDIPIGLSDEGNRACDIEARKLIAPHQSRVFLGARRWILDCTSPAQANQEARRRRQKGVAVQLFCLKPKIAEADKLVRRMGQDKIIETHPELVFWRLNNCRPLPSKKTKVGLALRRALLERDGFDDLNQWLQQRIGKGAKADDIFDACACAIAARDCRHKVPATDALADGTGLRMEINF